MTGWWWKITSNPRLTADQRGFTGMQWTAATLSEATRGKLLQGEPAIPLREICTDTRCVEPGDCFLALPGEIYDGHDFIPQALARNAGAILAAAGKEDKLVNIPLDVPVIVVPDTLYALGELARFHRGRHTIPVIGITGSNGKTSTKEMVAEILGQTRRVHKNQGNFNNLIGVPLTLLSLRPEHEMAVVEMGINVRGEMARLVEISGPTAGLITNIYPAHLEGLGSLEGVLEEKGKLWRGLSEDGLAVVNLDDPRLAEFSKTLKTRIVTYSLADPSAQVMVDGSVERDGEMSVFRLRAGKETVPIRLSVLGLHQVQNAVAAAALAWGLGESLESIAAGLSNHRPFKQRMQIYKIEGERVIIDDTYNANPGSMIAAVKTLLSSSNGHPCVAIVGEMRELGPESASLHREVGRQIGSLGVSHLIAMGNLGQEIIQGALETGLTSNACWLAGSHQEAAEWVRKEAPEGAWILVKGSRGMTMERIVNAVVGDR
jgi:UDP-N-acetylmuramoyl-tripeptide--D-alanyl-D-alanine ligase